jgi:hypothetical protein
MSLSDFYAKVLPPTGIYSAFRSASKRHWWFETIEELTAFTERQTGIDVYFGVASFIAPGEDEYKGRTQSNVKSLKCFRLDLDAGPEKLAKWGPGKVYPTQADAIASLVEFTKKTGLRFSLLVSSGMGLHVYYVLDAAVSPGVWQPIAKRLQKFGTSHGMRIDPSVTSDYARVLRPIGTKHPSGNVVQVLRDYPVVYTIEQFAEAIGAEVEEDLPAVGMDTSVNDDIMVVQGPPKSFKKALLKCGALEHAYRNQATTEEPYWRAVIGVTKHTVEGLSAAILVSRKHPDFDEGEVEAKFDRWETGPSTCETFEDFVPEICAACPHKGKIKSPVQLGALTVQEEDAHPEAKRDDPPAPKEAPGKPWNGKLPDAFDVVSLKGKETLVHHMDIEEKNDDGEFVRKRITVPITHDVFWMGQCADAVDTDDTAQIVIHKSDRGLIRNYTMEQSLVASRADLVKFLASKGIHLTTDRRAQTAMEAYAKSQIQRVKVALNRQKITDRFGIRIQEDGTMVAAQGEYVIFPSGKIERAMLAKGLRGEAQHYTIPIKDDGTGTWEPTVWKSHILPSARVHVEFMKKFYAREGMEKYQLAIMLAMASPFMAFVTDGYRSGVTLPPNGLSIALFSEQGGRGKSTAMRCAQLAFGMPSGLNKDNDDLNTTALARLARFSISGTMPVTMDEMGDMDSKALATLIRTIANGAGRQRATRDGGLSVSSPWSLISLIGTNKSQREIIGHIRKESSAEQYRLLELDVEKTIKFDTETQVQFNNEWKGMGAHAGALGALIHLMICSTGVDKINSLVAEKVEEASRLVQGVHEESASRFQYRALGAMLTLWEMLERHKLVPFDKATLINTFLDAYKQTVDFVAENVTPDDGLSWLSKMLASLQPYTLITETETRRGGQSTRFDIDIRGVPTREAKARFVLDSQKSYVPVDVVRAWCMEQGVRETNLLNAAKGANALVRITAGETSDKRWASRFNLHKGMRESTNAFVMCYCFDVKAIGKAMGVDLGEHLSRVEPETNVVQLRGT